MKKNGILNEILKTHSLKSIEQHLIYSYLINNNIKYSQCNILSNYLLDFEQNFHLFIDVSSFNISTIKELENYLELIIPENDRKINGAFFTPYYIIDFIINEIRPAECDTNIDISCGCGAFLVGLTDYYKNNFNKSIKKIIKENIFGSDILEYNIHRTKLILTIYALQNNEILDNDDFNLWCQDSLRTEWKMKFDNIVGNPPYVKFQDLTDDNRDYLAKHWDTVEGGTFNLYFVFFEIGYQLLKTTGKLGYITPNNYFTSISGESIRKFFQQKKCINRIIDFNHKKVFDAQTYTAITFLNKSQNDFIIFDRLSDNQSPEIFLANANGSPNYLINLNIKKWRLLKSDEQENIRIIENLGTPIGKLFDICVGIATLKDEIYFIDGNTKKKEYYTKTTDKGTYEIEIEATKSVYKISDFKTQEDTFFNKRKIIFPYQVKNGIAHVITETDFKKKYPKCYKYLLSEKDNLLARDKGKVNYDPFFAWGRTQGIAKFGKKILNPTFSQHPRFLLIEEEESYFTNGYGIFLKKQESDSLFNETINPLLKDENIDIVVKILNSHLMDYYISRTSVAIEGGYPCYQKNFIEKFTIPDFSEEEIELLRSLNDKQEIDIFLSSKYHLNFSVPNLVE